MAIGDRWCDRVWEDEEPEKENNDTNSLSYSDLKLYGMPIVFIEKIIIIFGFIGTAYLLCASKALFAGIGKSIISILILLVMVFTISMSKSIVEILTEDVFRFKKQFVFKGKNGKVTHITKITTSDQISFLMKFAINVIKHWKVSYLVYMIFIAVLYIIYLYIGLLLTALLSLIVLIILWLKVPEILESLKRYLKSKTRKIPAQPPSVGVMTLFGNPLFDVISDSGTLIIYPGVIDFLVVEVHQEPEDFEEIGGLFAKGNVPVKARKVQVLYKPEITELEEFISAKEQSGVRDALENMIASKLRKIVAEYSFDQLIGDNDNDDMEIIEELELELIKHLTGVDKIDSRIIKEMAKNGKRDSHLLGIKIYRISISSIETSDEYLAEMVKAAAELKQREGETQDTETETMQARILFEAYKEIGEPKTFNYCLQQVMDNKSVREGHSVVPGKRGFYESLDAQKLAAAVLEIVKELKK
ncbi:MAG: SPFH domain-containing protein [Patescibacteria group bacterium]|nr:SPFH domain-containing protein [Patescibacteria group bacterium]